MVSCLSTSLTVLLWPLPLIPAHLPSMYSLRLRKAAAEAEGQAHPQQRKRKRRAKPILNMVTCEGWGWQQHSPTLPLRFWMVMMTHRCAERIPSLGEMWLLKSLNMSYTIFAVKVELCFWLRFHFWKMSQIS